MKSIQVMFDEKLLARLDADAEVKLKGRSAVLRQAAAEYLKKRRRAEIREEYRRAYGEKPATELEGWAGEASWLDD